MSEVGIEGMSEDQLSNCVGVFDCNNWKGGQEIIKSGGVEIYLVFIGIKDVSSSRLNFIILRSGICKSPKSYHKISGPSP